MTDNYTPGDRALDPGIMPGACRDCDYYCLRVRRPETEPCRSCTHGEGGVRDE